LTFKDEREGHQIVESFSNLSKKSFALIYSPNSSRDDQGMDEEIQSLSTFVSSTNFQFCLVCYKSKTPLKFNFMVKKKELEGMIGLLVNNFNIPFYFLFLCVLFVLIK